VRHPSSRVCLTRHAPRVAFRAQHSHNTHTPITPLFVHTNREQAVVVIDTDKSHLAPGDVVPRPLLLTSTWACDQCRAAAPDRGSLLLCACGRVCARSAWGWRR
jgi:hypothetical protein